MFLIFFLCVTVPYYTRCVIIHVSDALISLHWLRISERIRSKVAILVYNVIHGCAPSYFGPFKYDADLPSRRVLRSSYSNYLVQSIDQSNYFIVRLKVEQRAGQLSLLHLGITVTEK